MSQHDTGTTGEELILSDEPMGETLVCRPASNPRPQEYIVLSSEDDLTAVRQ